MSAQNFLQDYVRKILEIQQQRERSSISEQEMKQIAEDMGIDYGQIEEVKLAYWMRGEGHLRNHNFEDALDEFKQLLILSPNDPNVFYNIASCYAGTWFAKGKKAAREEALKFAEACIDIDPAHEKAFKLIGELKGTKKATAGTAYKPTQQPNNKIAVKIVVAVLIFSFLSSLIPVFITLFKSSKSLTNSFQQLRGTLQSETINLGSVRGGVASIGPKGSVLWVISQASSGSKFQALVISLNEKKQIATIDLPAFEGTSFSQPMAMAGAIYFFDQKQGIFEARDMYTGEIVENNKILANRYEPLKAGVGKIKSNSDGWIDIVTTDGQEFHYFPEKQLLFSDAEWDKLSNKSPKAFNQYIWYFLKDGQKKQYALTMEKQSPRYMNIHTYGYASTDREIARYRNTAKDDIASNIAAAYRGNMKLIADFSGKPFLNAKVIYQDSTQCILGHVSAIGSEGKKLVSKLTADGKIAWEKEVPAFNLLAGFFDGNGGNVLVKAYGDKLLLYTIWGVIKDGDKTKGSSPIMLELNLKTGEFGKEYAPAYKLD